MKLSLISTLCFLLASCTGRSDVSCPSRDLVYEHYCDSIWQNNPDYYNDVLAETDEYINYIQQHGSWWKED